MNRHYMFYEESIIQKDLSTMMTIVEINKSAGMEKENTINNILKNMVCTTIGHPLYVLNLQSQIMINKNNSKEIFNVLFEFQIKSN